LMALILGAFLGISGAIFQSLTKNALGSPDVIGFKSGCYFGALVVILAVRPQGLAGRAFYASRVEV